MHELPNISAIDRVNLARLHAWMSSQRKNLVDDLATLAGLETPSDDLFLLEEARRYIETWIEKRLGRPNHLLLHSSTKHGPTIVLDYPGTTAEELVMIGHFDTVFPAGTLINWPIRLEHDRLSGPGVFDMKGGLVQMVWAIKSLFAVSIPRPSIRIVLNSDEEIGSPFSKPVIEDACSRAMAVLVFEGSAKNGAIKTARKGVGLFTITVEGVESHAGLEPEAGTSAIDEIANIVRTLHDGTNLDLGTSINVGVIHGGSRANVVAGNAYAEIDVRVASNTEKLRVDALLGSLRTRSERATIRIDGGWNRPIMSRTAGNAKIYELAVAVGKRVGLTLPEASVGGASDGNFVAALGIPVLDGLGAVGSGAHARHENISVDAMVERATLAAGVIAAFAST